MMNFLGTALFWVTNNIRGWGCHRLVERELDLLS